MNIDYLYSGLDFEPDLIGGIKKSIAFFSFTSPLLANIIDGFPSKAFWKINKPCGATRSFFQNLKPIVTQYEATWAYITNDHNESSNLHWTKQVNSECFNEYIFEIFERSPTVQGNEAYLCLIFDSLNSMIVFEYDEAEATLKIDYYGCDRVYQEIANAIF